MNTNVVDNSRIENLISALFFLNPTTLTEEEWRNCGMALKHEGIEYSVFDEWSALDPERYNPKENRVRWESFNSNSHAPITGDSIFRMAYDLGWKSNRYSGTETDTNDDVHNAVTENQCEPVKREDAAINTLHKILKGRYYKGYTFVEPGDEWKPEQDSIRFLQALFCEGDFIAIHTKADLNEKNGKWHPCDNGFILPFEDLTLNLNKYTVSEVLGKPNSEAGVWVKVNPMNAVGHEKEDVTAYRHVLVECDQMPVDEQIALYHELNLPITALVYSGNKSAHAIVKINAVNLEQYEERVRFMYDICKRYGIPLDPANKNPNRMTRFPGVLRGEHKQFLIETNTGASSFESWQKMVIKGMYGVTPLDYATQHPKSKPPVLVQNVLFKGHKMLIVAPSKQRKTWMLIDLAVSIANGLKWLGFNCTTGKVLYINLEVDAPFFEDRFKTVCRAKGVKDDLPNIDVLHGRGISETFGNLANVIHEMCETVHEQYSAIIVDPLYKVLEGDENSNTDMKNISLATDKLVEMTGAALIVTSSLLI